MATRMGTPITKWLAGTDNAKHRATSGRDIPILALEPRARQSWRRQVAGSENPAALQRFEMSVEAFAWFTAVLP
jgi:hypothetical protein